MSITYAEICDAVETTLGAATGITYHHSYNELTEGMQDWPTLQIYWQSDRADVSSTNADRTTFKGHVRQSEIVIYADLLAVPRAHIGEDMAALLPLVDAIKDVIEAQDEAPYFGLSGIRAFAWTAERVSFIYGNQTYIGARFTLRMRIF